MTSKPTSHRETLHLEEVRHPGLPGALWIVAVRHPGGHGLHGDDRARASRNRHRRLEGSPSGRGNRAAKHPAGRPAGRQGSEERGAQPVLRDAPWASHPPMRWRCTNPSCPKVILPRPVTFPRLPFATIRIRCPAPIRPPSPWTLPPMPLKLTHAPPAARRGSAIARATAPFQGSSARVLRSSSWGPPDGRRGRCAGRRPARGAPTRGEVRLGVSVGGTGLVGVITLNIAAAGGPGELTVGTITFREVSVSVVGKRYFGDGNASSRRWVRGLWSLTAWTEDGSGSILIARVPLAVDWRVTGGHAMGLEVALNRALAVNRLDPEDDTPPNTTIVPLPGTLLPVRLAALTRRAAAALSRAALSRPRAPAQSPGSSHPTVPPPRNASSAARISSSSRGSSSSSPRPGGMRPRAPVRAASSHPPSPLPAAQGHDGAAHQDHQGEEQKEDRPWRGSRGGSPGPGASCPRT
jgi:hypothetical protein